MISSIAEVDEILPILAESRFSVQNIFRNSKPKSNSFKHLLEELLMNSICIKNRKLHLVAIILYVNKNCGGGGSFCKWKNEESYIKMFCSYCWVGKFVDSTSVADIYRFRNVKISTEKVFLLQNPSKEKKNTGNTCRISMGVIILNY
jgi:hypothetical protein